MAKKKYELTVSDEQIARLRSSLQVGAPLRVALSFAKISVPTFYYWLSLASIVSYVRGMEGIKENSEKIKSGISLSQIKERSLEFQNNNHEKSTIINGFTEPTDASILRYRNNKDFQEFCDQVYDIVVDLDYARSEAVIYHLKAIREAAGKQKVNTLSSQWFLERTLPDDFGRVRDNDNQEQSEGKIPPIKVEFVDPNTKESKDRVAEMEQLIDNEINGYRRNVN